MNPSPLPDVTALAEDLLAAGGDDVYRDLIRSVDAALIAAAVAWCGPNQVKIAARLGLSRTTLRAKFRRCGLTADGRRKPAAV